MDPAVPGASSALVKLRQFYRVKPHTNEDPRVLESQINQVQELVWKIHESRAPILQELEFRKTDLEKLSWISSYSMPHGRYQATVKLDLLQWYLAKLSFLVDCEKQIRELKRQLIHHQMRPQKARERNIFRKLNDLIRTREADMGDSSHAEENAKIVERWGSKENIRQKIKECQLTISNSDMYDSEISFYNSREKNRFQKKKASIEKDVIALERKIMYLNKEKARAHEFILYLTRLKTP